MDKNKIFKKCSECEAEYPENKLLMIKKGQRIDYICVNCKDELGLKSEVEYIDEIRSNMITPKEMTKRVSKYVIGQEDAIKTLSVEIYKHFLRSTSLQKKDSINIKKNNIVLVGPTASGKSYMVENFAKEVGLPFSSIDITTISPVGYAGGDINSVLLNLLKKSESEFIAERGIVFIDEIDKIIEHKSSDNLDIRGKMLQQSLLKILEGDIVELSEQNFLGRISKAYLDTSNILFICAGAFVGIEDTIRNRLKVSSKKTVGFCTSPVKRLNSSNDDNYYRKQLKSEDLIEYGFIPEMIGRLPIILTLDKLSLEQMVEVLNAKGGIIEEYIDLFKMEKKNLKVSDDAVELLARISFKSKIGARGLRSIMAKITNEIFYSINTNRKKEILITSEMIKEILPLSDLENIFDESLFINLTEKL